MYPAGNLEHQLELSAEDELRVARRVAAETGDVAGVDFVRHIVRVLILEVDGGEVGLGALGLELEDDGRTVKDIRVGLGGVATKPWRARAVEQALIGKVLDDATIKTASLLAMEGAVAQGDNQYKIDLVPRVVARAIETVSTDKSGGLA